MPIAGRSYKRNYRFIDNGDRYVYNNRGDTVELVCVFVDRWHPPEPPSAGYSVAARLNTVNEDIQVPWFVRILDPNTPPAVKKIKAEGGS